MVSMVRTTWPPLRRRVWPTSAVDAVDAGWWAWRARSALCDTVPVRSTDCRALQVVRVCSVRWLRSSCPGHLGLATRMDRRSARFRPPGCAGAPAWHGGNGFEQSAGFVVDTSTCEVGRRPRNALSLGQWVVMLAVIRQAISGCGQWPAAPAAHHAALLWVCSAELVAWHSGVYRKDQNVIKRGLWCQNNNGARRPVAPDGWALVGAV